MDQDFWKGKLRWSDFPDDVLLLIVSHLTQQEILLLVEALVGPGPVPPTRVTMSIRDTWMRCCLCASFRNFVYYQISEEALYRTKGVSRSFLCLDWSVFSPTPLRPVAVFYWYNCRPCIEIKEDVLLQEIMDHAKRKVPIVRLTVHQQFNFWGRGILRPQPIMIRTYPLVPLSAIPFVTAS